MTRAPEASRARSAGGLLRACGHELGAIGVAEAAFGDVDWAGAGCIAACKKVA